MISKVILGTMTMNAGMGIPGSTIRWALSTQFKEFAKVVVIDGDMTPEAKEFYSKFPNVVAIDSPWKDSYVDQYKRFAEELKDDEWGLWLDDDEICSPELLAQLSDDNFNCLVGSPNRSFVSLIKLPCILHITENGKDYYPAEPYPVSESEYNAKQWTKNILFKKNKSLTFYHFGSHVIPKNQYEMYIQKPYYHMKSLESFVYNDVWQAFLCPEGQGYTPEEAARFKLLTSCYKSTKEFKEATKKGTWSPPLKKFAWENRRQYNRPISRLAWVYYVLEGNPMPEHDEFMYWDELKQHVLSCESNKIYNLEKDRKQKGIVINNV